MQLGFRVFEFSSSKFLEFFGVIINVIIVLYRSVPCSCQGFEIFITALGKKKANKELKQLFKAVFLNLLGEGGTEIFNSLDKKDRPESN